MTDGTQVTRYKVYDRDSSKSVHAKVIIEKPVTLTVNGSTWLTFMCTPIELEALALGFLFNEELVQSKDDIVDLRVCPGMDNIDIWSNVPLEQPTRWKRTSGCTGGVTSVNPAPSNHIENPAGPKDPVLTTAEIESLLNRLYVAQKIYRESGGVHTSVLTDGQDNYLEAEDIGRHNTLDKLAGKYLCLENKFSPCVLLTTGRVSSEMLQKSSRIGVSFVISRTSPTSLSIDLAIQNGITLIGYARRNQFKVYSFPERISNQKIN